MKKNRTSNLTPFTSNQDRETARENGRAGGVASGAARRKRKEMREFLNDYLDREAVPHVKTWMKSHGIKDEDCCNLMAMILAVFCRAMAGDIKAANTVLEWAGMLPLQHERELAELAYYRSMLGNEKKDQSLPDEDISLRDVVIYDPATGTPTK